MVRDKKRPITAPIRMDSSHFQVSATGAGPNCPVVSMGDIQDQAKECSDREVTCERLQQGGMHSIRHVACTAQQPCPGAAAAAPPMPACMHPSARPWPHPAAHAPTAGQSPASA